MIAAARAFSLLLLVLAGGPPAAAQAVPQLVVSNVAPDASGETITITGQSFGTRPFVTLDLVPLPVRVAVDTQIVAVAPVNQMPPGEYLLTVARGPSSAERGSFLFKIGPPAPGTSSAKTAAPPTSSVSGGTGPEVLPPPTDPAARVGDRVITVADVDREWRRTNPTGYLGFIRQLYDTRRRILDALVADDLLAREAASRGITVDALLKEEIPKRIVSMPDSAVTSLYQSLGDMTRGASLEQLRPALRAWLERNTEPELAKMTYLEELMKVSTRAETLLSAPRVPVEHTPQDVALGPASAPVEIVAFGDFQSADYARMARALAGVRETFGDRLRLVFKNLPTAGPESVAAAEAALCAHTQGKFWAFHDALLASFGATISARLAESATKAGLARDAFQACIDGGEFRDLVRQSVDEAERYGIPGVPSFLVNGRLAPASPPFLPPFDFFKRLIEEELSRAAKSR